MKVVANPEPKNSKTIKFPCIMEWKGICDTGLVVLFVDNSRCVVLVSGKNERRTGEFRDNWTDSSHDDWVPYRGSITISND